MSAAAPARASARPASRPRPRPEPAKAARSPRPALRLVEAPRLAPGPLPFALVIAGVLGAGLVSLLLLHTLAAQDAFTLHKLARQSAELGDVEQQLTVADQQAQAPSALAARAKALGMVPTGSLHIVRRRDGRIVAIASAVVVPVPAATPTAAPAASPTPAPSASAGPTASASPSATSRPAATGGARSTRPVKPRRPR